MPSDRSGRAQLSSQRIQLVEHTGGQWDTFDISTPFRFDFGLAGNNHPLDAGRKLGGLDHADHCVHPRLEEVDWHEGRGVDRDAEVTQPLRLVARRVVKVPNLGTDARAGQDARQNFEKHRDPETLVAADGKNPAAVEDAGRIIGRTRVAIDSPPQRYAFAAFREVDELAAISDPQ